MAGFQEVNVNRNLDFVARAEFNPNIKGNPSTEKMCSVDWFDQTALDTSKDYTVTVAGSLDTIALSAGGLAGVTVATGVGDNEVAFLATGVIFDITQAPIIETKIKIVDVSKTFVYFGFSDEVNESTPAATIDGDSATEVAAATDAVGFVIDADFGTSSIYGMSVKTGGTIQKVDSKLDWANNESYILRVALDTNGNARFYVDGMQVGYLASAVADVALCAIWNFGTRDGSATQTVYARYLKKWQNIP